MTARPFPDCPNAEVCVHTGAQAFALVGGKDRDRVQGWYGSTVIDGDTMVAVDDAFPRGFISDAALREALDRGQVYDPDPILHGNRPLSEVPDRVILALLCMGMASAVRGLDAPRGPDDGPADQIPVAPVHDVENDDPLAFGIVDGLFGRQRSTGVDLEAVGRFWAILARARGRDTDEAARDAGARAILGKVRSNESFVRELLGSMAREG